MVKRVLVINDCRLEKAVLKEQIARLGYEVGMADENDCLPLVASFRPDVVIANLTLKNTTGDIIIKQIKQEHPEIHCLLSSCSPITREVYPGLDGIFQTPVSPDVLRGILAGNSETARAGKSAFAFCPFCGTRFAEPASEFTFCPFCGNRL